ncbi:MAG TPA: GNAT family N-acetyltransferase [Nocardioidaceae bacterium]|nr:GNAT family N-acetyltransferase [Nocardioidaceae bacterium]
MGVDLEFFTDPTAFLAAAGDRLIESPVESTVVATIAERAAHELADGIAQPEHDWYVVARDGSHSGDVVGVGMRTAPFEPRPLYLLTMPDEAATALAVALFERGEEVRGANGALPASRVFAEETARLSGRAARVHIHTRLFELRELTPPSTDVSGRLRAAVHDDLELVKAWYAAFMRDADEQAGRPPGSGHDEDVDDDVMLRRIDDGRVWFWVDGDKRPVHVTGTNPPSFGVARIGPVYTPREERGRGWASAAVAEVSRRMLDEGSRPCLFTDQANPTSNGVYVALGYQPVVDTVHMLID